MKELYKQFEILKEKLGIKAWEEINIFFNRMNSEMEDLRKSRDNHKAKRYEAEAKLKEVMKDEIKETKKLAN